tara:strand:+ start:142 stop:801 length:660 start_codon:yes stop_codon:yes gene_type:complete
MQLDWQAVYDENKLVLDIENLHYETIDGGQNIDKYIDGVFDKRIKQYPDMPVNWTHGYSPIPPVAEKDEWPVEVQWLIEQGHTTPLYIESTTYKEKDGSFTTESFIRGSGHNNLDDLQSVNRLGQPASVQERWDWDIIAECDSWTMGLLDFTVTDDPDIKYAVAGIVWLRHKETNEITRAGSSQHCPCHVFPQIYRPVVIAEEDLASDLAKYNATLVSE